LPYRRTAPGRWQAHHRNQRHRRDAALVSAGIVRKAIRIACEEVQIALDTPRLDLAVIIPALEKYGGAERFVIECLRRWQKRHRITLYSTAFSDPLLAEHGIDQRVRRVQLSPYFEGEHGMLLNAVVLPRLWRDEIGPHQLYHTHLWPTHLIDRHPMVWYPHEPLRVLHDLRYEQKHDEDGDVAHVYPKYDYDRFGERLFEPYLNVIEAIDGSVRPERIVANSRYSAEYIGRVYHRKVEDIVYPGAEPTPLELPRDPNLFLTVGQLWEHKRIRILIEALALTNETQLVVIGSGPEREWLGEVTERLGVSDRVFFMSGLRNRELELMFARACAFLFAPIREPFGIAVLEAMAAGLPIIAVKEGGYAEACTPESAFLIPAFPSEFAGKMSLLQSDAALRQRMGAAGRRIAAQFTWARTANELEAILTDVAAQSSGRAVGGSVPSRTLVGAQYYLWYGEGFGAAHWNDNPTFGHVADKPMLGFYGSAKGETIEAHLDEFEAMGLDFIVVNLHIDGAGPNTVEWRSIDHLLNILEARDSNLRFAIQIASYTDAPDHFSGFFEKVRARHMAHPNHLRLDGKPVIFWFWSGAFDGKKRLLAHLAKLTEGAINIAASLRLPAGSREADLSHELFAGFAPFSPLELPEAANVENVWNTAYRLAAEAGMPYRVASVSPGYDDTGLADERRSANPRRIVERADGATYRGGLGWIEGLTPEPHLAVISTFNEFHENTHIEASVRHARLYVDLTRQFVDRIRARVRGADA
jgi:glycosyltransferase involved in cell wall biosynthesis